MPCGHFSCKSKNDNVWFKVNCENNDEVAYIQIWMNSHPSQEEFLSQWRQSRAVSLNSNYYFVVSFLQTSLFL